MTILCVDDEKQQVETTAAMCRELPDVDDVREFTGAGEALAWLRDHPADVALLDIGMPDMDGLKLAAEIRRIRPDTEIIFLTAHPEYALQAYEVRAIGYLVKPVSGERLAADLAYAAARMAPRRTPHVEVRTFGNFDLFVDGRIVRFRQSRCKELLAYLIDRQGSDVSRAEAFSILWEDRSYDRSMQKQFDVIIRSLKKTLEEYGAAEIFELGHAKMRIHPETISCDLYRFLNGDSEAVKSFRGEYLNNYSWASGAEGYLHRRLQGRPNPGT